MKNAKNKGILFAAIIIIALTVIAVGSLMMWKSFKAFDNTVIKEKDSQFINIIQAEDSNLQISLNGFARETEAFFNRKKVEIAIQDWTQNENIAPLKLALDEFSVVENDIYAGLAVYQDKTLVKSLSTEQELSFINQTNKKNYEICKNADGRYFLAYMKNMPESMKFCVLIDLVNLVNDVAGEERSAEDMTFIVDSACSIMMYKYGDLIDVISIDEALSDIVGACRNFIVSCQSSGISDSKSVEITDDGSTYTARMLVRCVDDTKNGIFAIGKTTNYNATIKPSRGAANRILLFGGVAAVGVVLLLIALVLMRKINNTELEIMRKRNETLKEINREMQELTHHQRLETLGTMTAGIAHDFNNLLTPIMGYSMMTMELLPEDATDLQENLMEVYNASVKAKDIVSQLADLTRSGDEAYFDIINPDEIIQSALKVTLPVKPESVEVKINLSCSEASIKGDRTQLSQLLMNLTLNAYDAMSEHGGTLLVSTKIEDGKIVMRFRDSGIGMDAETVAKMFDPFFTTKGAGKGVGLGLAIVAQIAETHGAKVYVESQLGIGTEFKLIFDIADNKEAV